MNSIHYSLSDVVHDSSTQPGDYVTEAITAKAGVHESKADAVFRHNSSCTSLGTMEIVVEKHQITEMQHPFRSFSLEYKGCLKDFVLCNS